MLVRVSFPAFDIWVGEWLDRHADWIPSPVSSLALNWFKDHFIKCNDRAALVKTWLPVTYDGPKTWLDQLVYDRALVLVSHQFLFGRSGSNV